MVPFCRTAATVDRSGVGTVSPRRPLGTGDAANHLPRRDSIFAVCGYHWWQIEPWVESQQGYGRGLRVSDYSLSGLSVQGIRPT